MSRRFLILTLALMMTAGALSACGKRGSLEPPTKAGENHPREYPTK